MNVYRLLCLHLALSMFVTVSCAQQKGGDHLQRAEPQLKWKFETGG
jgi:hypothetical protein